MKYGFQFFIYFLLTNLSAQTVDSVVIKQVDSLIQVSRDLTAKKDFEKALEVNVSAEKLVLETMGRESAAYGSCLFNLGRINHLRGDKGEAEKWYLEAMVIQEKVIGKEHAAYAQSLNNLASIYSDMGKYEKAEPIYLESKAIREKVLGKEHPDYAVSLTRLANLYMDLGKFDNAELLYLEIKAIREVEGMDHPKYAWSLNDLALLYMELGKYEKAELLFLESKAIMGKVLGKEHPYYANSLNNLAILYFSMSKYEEVEALHLESIAINEKVQGKEHLDYANSLSNLAILYTQMGKYEKAEPLNLESKEIREKIFGKEHPNYAQSVSNLAINYMEMGNYEKAEPLYLEAKIILEKVYGKENPIYAHVLSRVGGLYYQMGKYEKAEPLILESKEIREKIFGKEHPDYAESINSLGVLYWEMGDLKKAELYFLEAIKIREKIKGKDNLEYTNNLVNLAILYLDMENYDKVEPLHLEAKEIREKVYGKEHRSYANSIHNLSNFYFRVGKFELAESFILESMRLWEKTIGKEHLYYLGSSLNLANLYHKQGKFEQAELLYNESLPNMEKVIGKEHPEYVNGLLNLAFLYKDVGHYNRVEPIFREVLIIKQKHALLATGHLSEKEMQKYLKTFQVKLERIYSSIEQMGYSHDMAQLCYDNTLFFKGFLLQSTGQLKRLALSDPDASEKFNLLKSYERRLADQYAKPISDRDSTGFTDLIAKTNELEKVLARTVAGFDNASRQVKWQDVQSSLNQGEAAVEFVSYNFYQKNQKTDSVLYAALVALPTSTQPLFIHLFEEKKLDHLLESRQQRKSDYVNNLYAWAEHDTNNQEESGRSLTKLGGQKQSLYELIWEKIEDAGLKDVKTIYYAPSGILHRINMGAIAIGEQQLLSDRYQLIAVNSTRQIVTGLSDSSYTVGRNAIVYGGIQFEADTTEIIPLAESEYPLLATRSLAAVVEDSTLRGGSWQYLHWTQKEAEVITTTLLKGGLKAGHHSGIQATEERFKTMGQSNSHSPRVLHIATHGFFFPDPEQKTATSLDDQSVFKWSDNPMIRSGLILAGGNYAWQNGKPVSPEREDGILTAYEISQMNLSNTELVVLSACETGLGDIQGNEGVYGLQRAFKIAGAKYLIMSLWQVPDRETMEFMTTFYKNWLPSDAEALAGKEGKMTIPDAFRKTHREMRDRFYNPYSWAGFVLVE